MTDLMLNFLILSCIFNIPYYWFNWEEKIIKHVQGLQDTMIREMERRDPSHPFLKELRNRPVESIRRDLDSKPVLKLIRDMIFFPLNLVLMFFIVIENIFIIHKITTHPVIIMRN